MQGKPFRRKATQRTGQSNLHYIASYQGQAPRGDPRHGLIQDIPRHHRPHRKCQPLPKRPAPAGWKSTLSACIRADGLCRHYRLTPARILDLDSGAKCNANEICHYTGYRISSIQAGCVREGPHAATTYGKATPPIGPFPGGSFRVPPRIAPPGPDRCADARGPASPGRYGRPPWPRRHCDGAGRAVLVPGVGFDVATRRSPPDTP